MDTLCGRLARAASLGDALDAPLILAAVVLVLVLLLMSVLLVAKQGDGPPCTLGVCRCVCERQREDGRTVDDEGDEAATSSE